MIGIYKITNKINLNSYVGQSRNISLRWKNHRQRAFNSTSKAYDYPLSRAFRKYGIDNFSFEVLEKCSIEKLNIRERYWIDFLKPEYNQTIGENYQIIPKKLTEEDVKEIQNKLLSTCKPLKNIAEEYNLHPNMVGNINAGRSWFTEGIKYPIRETTFEPREKKYCKDCGVLITKNSTRCQSCAAKLQPKKVENLPSPLELARMVKELGFEGVGRHFNVSGNLVKKWCKNYKIPHLKQELIEWYNQQTSILPNYKRTNFSVQQIDIKTNEIINTYETPLEAGKAIGRKDSGHITDVCNGKGQTAYGYKWKYVKK